MNKKICVTCKIEKFVKNFSKDKKLGFRKSCKACDSVRNRSEAKARYRANNPDKLKDSQLKVKYGIDLIKFNEMLVAQNGRCAICNKEPTNTGKYLVVDHDHSTNKLRGLLCINCNSGIGHLKDNTEILLSAVKYIINYQQQEGVS